MDFTAADKKEVSFTEKFPFGVHPVLIIGFNLKTADNGNEFMEIGFTNMDQTIEDKARVYFTEKARLYSLNTMRQIFVHNAPEDKKDVARKQIDAVANTDELIKIMASKKALQAWVTKYADPIRTYQGTDGRTYKSTNINIYGYEPKINESLMPKPQESVATAAQATFGEEPPFKNEGSEASDWS